MSIFGFNVFLRRNTGFFLKHSASRFQSSVAYFTGFFYRVSVGWHLSDRVLSSFTELLFQVTELNLIYRVFFVVVAVKYLKKRKKPRLGVIWVVHLLSQIFVSLLTVHFFLQPKHFVDIRFFLKKKIKKRWGRRARTADFKQNPPPPLKSPQKTFKLFFFLKPSFFLLLLLLSSPFSISPTVAHVTDGQPIAFADLILPSSCYRELGCSFRFRSTYIFVALFICLR